VGPDNVETVAVYLGAVRSLSTISSAAMALHPEVTVLNHGFGRVFADPRNDFLRTPTPETLDRFVRNAAEMALGGRQGDHGGHILHSHAFKADADLARAYRALYGWEAKAGSRCLLWKDATKVTNHIARHQLDIGAIARDLPTLRFIALVRNPVDITVSSIRKGYSEALVGAERKADYQAVFVQVLHRFAWFCRHAVERPDQFRFIYQDELLERAHLADLCAFLRISALEGWLDDIARLIRLRESYPASEQRKIEFKALTLRTIPDPAIAQRIADQIV
jgi:hypothetical protein